MSAILVSLSQAMDHVKAYGDDAYNVELKLQLASGIVLKHMGYDAIPTGEYDEDTSPPTLRPVYYDDESPVVLHVTDSVKAAVLLVLSELYENRESGTADVLSSTVIALLSTSFDPPFA